MLRYEAQVTPTLQATFSDHQLSYTDHYTQNGGLSFTDSTHGASVPRVALEYLPKANLAVRASAGSSIAPPYIALLTNTYPPQPDQAPPHYFTADANSGDVLPETSFGWDLGADRRLAAHTILSLDVYQTTLRNQFLQTTALTGTYTTPAGYPFPGTYPLYTTSTQNLGHSRYEGIEFALHDDPPVGFGYVVQGALQRAYPYDLPPGFYNTAAGPNTANLGVIPNVNFQATGQGYNGLSYSRVPYSQGYGEINYRTRAGGYAILGVTYYGPNNAYNEPAFGVVNGSFDQRLTPHVSALLSVTNLTGAYDNYYYNIYGGIPTPLINGQFGYTAGNVVGPRTLSLTLHMDL